MDFYIKKNATLPQIQVEISKNGVSDFNVNQNLSEIIDAYISIFNPDNNQYIVASKNCTITQSASTTNPTDISYYLNYQLTNRETKKPGKYEIQISLTDTNGEIILPLQEKVYLNILESFAIQDYPFSSNYIVDLPCCGPVEVLPPVVPVKGPALLFIEPISEASFVGNYLHLDEASFYGFSNGTSPQSGSDIGKYMDMYAEYINSLPNVITQDIPQSSGGFDSFGNAIVQYNFYTTEVSANTVSEFAWYTWVIPSESIGDLKQSEIAYGYEFDNLSTESMNNTIYQYNFYYTGTSYSVGHYSMYTTFQSNNFNLNNTNRSIYFKGQTVQ
jgi:hypothetical protein